MDNKHWLMDYEQRRAIHEAERNAAADEYFKLRAWILDTTDNRRLFEAGFDRAVALLSWLRSEASTAALDALRYRAVRECPSLVMSLGLLSGGSDLDARTDAYLADEKRGTQ